MVAGKVFFILFIGVFADLVNCHSEGEYYWRPWTPGAPPADGVTGRDYRGTSYILEAYVPNFGLYIGQAFANQHEVNVSATQANATLRVQRSQSSLVLCSLNNDKLAWYPTNYRTLQNELLSATITRVVGGSQANGVMIYIGRYVDTSLRTVFFGSIPDTSFYVNYHYSGRAYSQAYYEILIVDQKCTGS
ncbi:hypothetical protein NQ318_004308 [Aromia moschata]|uniref:Uncharacterized protein n=1 Tax=Aromia moschata TaxID=1265417 RepID=A0AAV8YSS1_9CUCU|nr:hypothetical protein NQ318_004308 [Aromia moschata]